MQKYSDNSPSQQKLSVRSLKYALSSRLLSPQVNIATTSPTLFIFTTATAHENVGCVKAGLVRYHAYFFTTRVHCCSSQVRV